MMLIDNKYNIGDRVYLATDVEQQERIIIGLFIRQGSISYILNCGATESWHFDFEITREKDIVKSTA